MVWDMQVPPPLPDIVLSHLTAHPYLPKPFHLAGCSVLGDTDIHVHCHLWDFVHAILLNQNDLSTTLHPAQTVTVLPDLSQALPLSVTPLVSQLRITALVACNL